MSEAPNGKALKLYISYWKRWPLLALGSFSFSLVLALQATIVPLLVAMALGQLISHHTINVGLIVFAGFFQMTLVVLGYLSDDRGVTKLHLRVEKALYEDCFEYLAHQDYAFFADRFGGSLVTQASRFAKSYTTFTDTLFFNLIPQLSSVLIALGIMTYYSLPLGLTVLVLWLMAMYVIVMFAFNRLPMRRAAVAKESEQVGELADTITNALTVKTFAAEDREIQRYNAINELRGELFFRSWHRAVRNGWIMQGFCAVLQMIVFVGGILAVYHHSLGVATFLLFQIYIFRIIDNIRGSSFIVRQLEVVAGDGQEMAELLEQPPLIQDRVTASKDRIKKANVAFEDVHFQYQGTASSEKLFEDFSLIIKPSEKIGLVGPSGGGKTTITRLLMRFLDIQGGAIRIDSRDIRDFKQQALRHAIAYVPQEPLLFHRSIRENISYGNPSATEAE
ncbi:MAG TPA: ABC transporter ATP-binding protein, partial [Candidatus Saccharimonadales bacterium]